jgi:hypothetical protein
MVTAGTVIDTGTMAVGGIGKNFWPIAQKTRR